MTRVRSDMVASVSRRLNENTEWQMELRNSKPHDDRPNIATAETNSES